VKRSFSTVFLWLLLAVGVGGCVGDALPEGDAGTDAGDAEPSDTSAPDGSDATGQREVGEICQGPEDCVEAASCIGTGQPDQYRCMQNCEERWRICDDGSVCTPRLNSAEPICFTAGTSPRGARCETNLECEPGTLCFGSGGELYCLEACHHLDPGVCPDDARCELIDNGGKGLCRSRLGASCTTSADCSSTLTCSEELGAEFESLLRAGYCTDAECASDADCPFDGVCRTVPTAEGNTQTAICMATCATDGDCRFNQDYRCLRDGYCDETSDPEACEAFRAGEDICFPVDLVSNF
jgi:hypothetical protein